MIRESATVFDDSFVPHRLLRNGHLQTLAAVFRKQQPASLPFETRLIGLDDGDQLVVLESNPCDDAAQGDVRQSSQKHLSKKQHRTVVFFHGLCGSTTSNYMQRIFAKFALNGYHAFSVNSRGCGIGAQFANGHTHAARIDDISAVIDFLANNCPDQPITLVAFSLSGNILLNYLAKCQAYMPNQVDSAIVVAPPIDLLECSRQLQIGAGRFYDHYFARQLLSQLSLRRRENPTMIDRTLDRHIETIADFDEAFTAHIAGYGCAWDYYYHASATHCLDAVEIPTRVLVAADDPVVPFTMFERKQFKGNLSLCSTQHGGHLGYIGNKKSESMGNWMDQQIEQWISSIANVKR